ncbi:MAG: XRE family transcriptional regulator [Oscillospiraceae bacterium]|nr:XRE family transcriptional regulator [Oscillospiraceae bacterium]
MNRIQELRKSKGISQEDLAQILNVQRPAVSKYESGAIPLARETIEKLMDYFEVTSDYLLCKSNVSQPNKKNILVPVFSRIPAEFSPDTALSAEEYEEISIERTMSDEEYFALKVCDASMTPEYRENDIVIFRKATTCNSGSHCAVTVGREDATFKKIIRHVDGIVLQSLNAEYDSVFYNNKEIEALPICIIGIFKELRRRDK